MTQIPHQVDEYCCSVIIPVYNGEESITRCLDALANQNGGSEKFETIVVDDGSIDRTAETIRDWSEQHSNIHLRLLHQENAGPAAARNHGAEVATAELLLFTDADCAPTPHWVFALTKPFDDGAIVGAKGTYLSKQAGVTSRFVQAEYEDRYDRMANQPTIDFIDTYSAAYRREIFVENGGFDPIFTTASVEDQEFSFRLARKGYQLIFVPNAQVWHTHDKNLREYVRRKYYIGYWKALVARRYPERMVQDSHTPQVLKLQILLLALTLAAVLLALIGLFWSPLYWFWSLVPLLIVAFLATTLPFLNKLAHVSWRLVLAGPFLIYARAAALGMGFLVGTIRFTGNSQR